MPKTTFIDSIRVTDPCTENWDEMSGNDRVRFCSHCSKNVNDISKLTRKQVIQLVRESEGRLCVRYIQHPKTHAPVFADRLYQISRRAPLMAAGVMTASLSLAAMTYAQGGIEVLPLESARAASRLSDAKACETPKSDPASNDPTAEPVSSPTPENISGNIELRQLETIEVQSVMLGAVAFVPEIEYKNPLSVAIQNQDIDSLRDLIARGGNVNGKEDDNSTPLFAAVESGNIDAVRLLLDYGAKVNSRNKERLTPLMMLDEDATRELVDLLINSGANVNLVSKDGSTALIRAARISGAEVLQALINAGADVNAQDKNGQTALMNAAYSDDPESVRALLLAGADVNLKNADDQTAWDQTSDSEVEDLLVSFGAAVDDSIPTEEP